VEYTLDFLRCGLAGKDRAAPVSEYRLCCSGELYCSQAATIDYRRSDVARQLLWKPFELMVVSDRFDDYPQELALAFPMDHVTEGGASGSMSFRPDRQVAADIANLLTVYTRRLVTVAGKVRTTWPEGVPGIVPERKEWPEPIVGRLTPVFRDKRPATVTYGKTGVMDIESHIPPAMPFDHREFDRFLEALVALDHAEEFLASVRLYALAMELLEEKAGAAYQLLVSSVEALAGKAADGPGDEAKKQVKARVMKRAQEMGLSESDAGELAVLACAGMGWSKHKFVGLIVEYAGTGIWDDDDVASLPRAFVPDRSAFKAALGNIYKARSDFLHAGRSYPASAGVPSGPMVPVTAVHELLVGGKPLPPVLWFERVVNSVLTSYVAAACGS